MSHIGVVAVPALAPSPPPGLEPRVRLGGMERYLGGLHSAAGERDQGGAVVQRDGGVKVRDRPFP